MPRDPSEYMALMFGIRSGRPALVEQILFSRAAFPRGTSEERGGESDNPIPPPRAVIRLVDGVPPAENQNLDEWGRRGPGASRWSRQLMLGRDRARTDITAARSATSTARICERHIRTAEGRIEQAFSGLVSVPGLFPCPASVRTQPKHARFGRRPNVAGVATGHRSPISGGMPPGTPPHRDSAGIWPADHLEIEVTLRPPQARALKETFGRGRRQDSATVKVAAHRRAISLPRACG